MDTSVLSNILQGLQILAMIAGGMFFLFRIESKLAVLNNVQQGFADKLTDMDKELKELAKVTIEIARQDERMTSQDLRINTLSLRIEEYLKLAKDFYPPSRGRNKG